MTDALVLLAIGAALGLVIGLLGGGGGILAVPLLVAAGQPFLVASSLSLVIVGAGAAAALVPHHRARRVDWRVGLTFGALGAVGAVVGARLAGYINPAILLGGLTVLLVAGAVAMLRSALGEHTRAESRALASAEKASVDTASVDTASVDTASVDTASVETASAETARVEMAGGAVAPALPGLSAPGAPPSVGASRLRVVGLASSVGLVTGLLGVGAGFVVVPALVSAMRLPIKKATATALVVIVMNSAVAAAVRHGSLGSLGLTIGLAAASATFAVIGALVSRRLPGWMLSVAFAGLMIVVAIYTIIHAAIAG